MIKRNKNILIAILLLAIGTWAYMKFRIPPSIDLDEITGIQNLRGESVDLTQLKGKPLIVNFWASWCPPCRKEVPNFERLKKEIGDDVQIIFLSDEDIPVIKRFFESRGNLLTCYKSMKRTEYDIYSIPTTYFYNSKGDLVSKDRDYLSYEELLSKTERLE